MNLFKKIDNFILKIKFTDILYLVLALIFLNCYNFFITKYHVSNLDNILMCFGLNFSTVCWYNFFKSVLKNK